MVPGSNVVWTPVWFSQKIVEFDEKKPSLKRCHTTRPPIHWMTTLSAPLEQPLTKMEAMGLLAWKSTLCTVVAGARVGKTCGTFGPMGISIRKLVVPQRQYGQGPSAGAMLCVMMIGVVLVARLVHNP